MKVRSAELADASCVADIYNHYIANTTTTFEEDVLDASVIQERIAESQELKLPWCVAENEAGQVVGYAYASKWKGRCAYRFSVEVTVYLHPENEGRGIGTRLYEVLFRELRAQGFRVVIGGISLPNPASIALHEKFGLRKCGHFEKVGYKFGSWIDVGYWQGFLVHIA